MPHFLDIKDISAADLRAITDAAHAGKKARAGLPKGIADSDSPVAGTALAMVFEKPSTRTRISFEMAMQQLGGKSVVMQGDAMQLGRGETVEDTARVISRYVDAIMIRAKDHDAVKRLAAYSDVPVINALTNRSHPCQILADVMTIEEKKGPIEGKKIAWVGDGNNVATSLIEAAVRLNFDLTLACPKEYQPEQSILDWVATQHGISKGRVTVTTDLVEAVVGASAVYTDTFVSMGDEDAATRLKALEKYQVNTHLMEKADKALFLHCLPAHRGEEVTSEVIDGAQSVVWDQAENRLHAQKAILIWCLTNKA